MWSKWYSFASLHITRFFLQNYEEKILPILLLWVLGKHFVLDDIWDWILCLEVDSSSWRVICWSQPCVTFCLFEVFFVCTGSTVATCTVCVPVTPFNLPIVLSLFQWWGLYPPVKQACKVFDESLVWWYYIISWALLWPVFSQPVTYSL